MSKLPPQLSSVADKLQAYRQELGHYAFIGFLILVAGLYGFVFMRIHTLGSAQPTQDAVTSQVKTAHTPRLDQNVVHQIQSLQDNSVSVQSLFNDARNNPFQ